MSTLTPGALLSITAARTLCMNGGARELREQHAISLGEMAAAIGTSADVVSRWETGQSRPNASLAFRSYADILGELVTFGEPAPNDHEPAANRPVGKAADDDCHHSG